ncbi:MAG: hypothetical protein Q9225_005737 [Loekoesia sp. 1 TL-2023]
MGLMFGGAHQMPMLLAFTLYNLCKHPEYLDPLIKEIEAMEQAHPDGRKNYDALPLMDSFLRETARMNPTVVLTMPRKVLHPFRFSDGPVVPADNWLVVPSHAIMQNPDYYDDPSTFDGFRFVAKDKTRINGEVPDNNKNRFSTPSFDFPFWGSVRRPWYSQPPSFTLA